MSSGGRSGGSKAVAREAGASGPDEIQSPDAKGTIPREMTGRKNVVKRKLGKLGKLE